LEDLRNRPISESQSGRQVVGGLIKQGDPLTVRHL